MEDDEVELEPLPDVLSLLEDVSLELVSELVLEEPVSLLLVSLDVPLSSQLDSSLLEPS